jgi:hypothetical protein
MGGAISDDPSSCPSDDPFSCPLRDRTALCKVAGCGAQVVAADGADPDMGRAPAAATPAQHAHRRRDRGDAGHEPVRHPDLSHRLDGAQGRNLSTVHPSLRMVRHVPGASGQ